MIFSAASEARCQSEEVKVYGFCGRGTERTTAQANYGDSEPESAQNDAVFQHRLSPLLLRKAMILRRSDPLKDDDLAAL